MNSQTSLVNVNNVTMVQGVGDIYSRVRLLTGDAHICHSITLHQTPISREAANRAEGIS